MTALCLMSILVLQGSCTHTSLSQSRRNHTLIIGVDEINLNKYQEHRQPAYNIGTGTILPDVQRIKQVASINRHNIIVLLNEQAICRNILDTLRHLGRVLKEDETAFVYFIGYGDTTDDKNSDEGTPFDQAFLAYDNLLADDYLYAVFNEHFRNRLIVLFADLRHFKSPIDLPDHYFLDFKNSLHESIAYDQYLNTTNCEMTLNETVNENFNLLYFGVPESLSGSNRLYHYLQRQYQLARFYGNDRSMTYRALACTLGQRLTRDRLHFIYREIGKDIMKYQNTIIFK